MADMCPVHGLQSSRAPPHNFPSPIRFDEFEKELAASIKRSVALPPFLTLVLGQIPAAKTQGLAVLAPGRLMEQTGVEALLGSIACQPAFVQCTQTYADPSLYYSTVAANVQAEFVSAVEQGRAGGTLSWDGEAWALSGAQHTTLKGCVCKSDVGTHLWITRCTTVGPGRFLLGDSQDQLPGSIRTLAPLVFGSDYAGRPSWLGSWLVVRTSGLYVGRFSAASAGPTPRVDAALLAMVLDPGCTEPSTLAPFEEGHDGARAACTYRHMRACVPRAGVQAHVQAYL